ncbi:hypothetical protein TNCV_4699261 [Trichonephila clavipes]|nr:hypothetical protein TNCV_4699261 [Trichonephila clavipes]
MIDATPHGGAWNDRRASLQAVGLLLGVLMSVSSIRRRLLHRGLREKGYLYKGSSANHHNCVSNGLMSTEPGKQS